MEATYIRSKWYNAFICHIMKYVKAKTGRLFGKGCGKVAEKYKSDKTSKTNAKSKMPNVIAIMNESLADFNFDGTLETSEDYLPFIRSMKKIQ
ncbi:MAG: hypothetical protein ACLT2Z_01095 [Eubacterium sp.]